MQVSWAWSAHRGWNRVADQVRCTSVVKGRPDCRTVGRALEGEVQRRQGVGRHYCVADCCLAVFRHAGAQAAPGERKRRKGSRQALEGRPPELLYEIMHDVCSVFIYITPEVYVYTTPEYMYWRGRGWYISGTFERRYIAGRQNTTPLVGPPLELAASCTAFVLTSAVRMIDDVISRYIKGAGDGSDKVKMVREYSVSSRVITNYDSSL